MMKEPLVTEIMGLFAQIQKRFEAEDDEEKAWLIENAPNREVAKLVQDMTVMELHVVDAIGRLGPVNGITISKQFAIPKGSVSKITRRLLAKQVISKELLPQNKKEVLFRTTSVGNEVFDLHSKLHERIEVGVTRFLQKYTEEELRLMIRVLSDSLTASWINPDGEQR
ncbi:MarR family transcriptional regulator [Brevibacillus reuszeri]|uniref:MarR family transcriptional regulator n=1 Tax=Brevibacillus reuszeri TaxID=54915 RepID=UPI0028989EC9|nr:MarR family transcriptional regulator [Brevibacillus reuszeri]